MKVLIAVDGSQGSFEAVDQIARVLSGERDEVALYCAPPDLQLREAPADPKFVAGARNGFAESIFEEARKRLPPSLEGRVKTIIGAHDARQGTLVAASEWSADLIAMGARGLNSLERLLLGSVSRAVVHRSALPVWIARAKPAAAPRGMNVLLACERPELGHPAAELAAKFTWPAETNFRAIRVVRSILAGRMPDWLEQQPRTPDVEAMVQAWAREHDEDLRASRAGMEEFVRGLPAPLNTSQAMIAEGEPATRAAGGHSERKHRPGRARLTNQAVGGQHHSGKHVGSRAQPRGLLSAAGAAAAGGTLVQSAATASPATLTRFRTPLTLSSCMTAAWANCFR